MNKSTKTAKDDFDKPVSVLVPLRKFENIGGDALDGKSGLVRLQAHEGNDIVCGGESPRNQSENAMEDDRLTGRSEVCHVNIEGEDYLAIALDDIAGVVDQTKLENVSTPDTKSKPEINVDLFESRQLLAGIAIQGGEILVDNSDELMQPLRMKKGIRTVEPIADMLNRLDDYSAAELQAISATVTQLLDKKTKLEAKAKLELLARALIDDFNSTRTVAPKDLTAFFAAKAKDGADKKSKAGVTKGEVLPDEAKQKLIELIQAFRATGGTVLYKGKRCVVDLRKTASMKQHSFRLRSDNHARDHILSTKTVPKLTFR